MLGKGVRVWSPRYSLRRALQGKDGQVPVPALMFGEELDYTGLSPNDLSVSALNPLPTTPFTISFR